MPDELDVFFVRQVSQTVQDSSSFFLQEVIIWAGTVVDNRESSRPYELFKDLIVPEWLAVSLLAQQRLPVVVILGVLQLPAARQEVESGCDQVRVVAIVFPVRRLVDPDQAVMASSGLGQDIVEPPFVVQHEDHHVSRNGPGARSKSHDGAVLEEEAVKTLLAEVTSFVAQVVDDLTLQVLVVALLVPTQELRDRLVHSPAEAEVEGHHYAAVYDSVSDPGTVTLQSATEHRGKINFAFGVELEHGPGKHVEGRIRVGPSRGVHLLSPVGRLSFSSLENPCSEVDEALVEPGIVGTR